MNYQYNISDLGDYSDTLIDFPNTKGTYYDPKELQERHKEIIRRLSLGQAKGDIAHDLQVTVAMVRYVSRSTLGQEYLIEMRDGREASTKSVQEQIFELAPDALDVIRETIMGKMSMPIINKKTGELETIIVPVPQKLRVETAKDVLSRAGHVAPTKVLGEITYSHNVNEIVAAAKAKVAEERIHNAEFTVLPIKET